MNKYPNNKVLIAGYIAILALTGFNTPTYADDDDNELVEGINKAPIAADGNVAYHLADYVIDLDPADDPTEPGLMLEEGDQFRIYLPKGTIPQNLEEFPVCGVGQPCGSTLGPTVCAPPAGLACTTAVFLQGWPQSPLFPNVDVTDNVLTVTARAATDAVVKQIHFIGKGFQNPGPGNYKVKVVHIRNGETIARGKGKIKMLPNVRPSINLTSVFVAGANTVLQSVNAGPLLPWNFLVWDTYGEPFMGITLRQRNAHRYQLRQNNRTVGHVKIKAPHGASGYSLSLVDQGTITTPVIGLSPGGGPAAMTQRYTATFDVGSNPADGCYETTFKMNNGNSWTLYVGSPGGDACADDDDDDD